MALRIASLDPRKVIRRREGQDAARDRVHLANIMRKIRVMPDVIKVTRNRN